ncbi:unnamed protein product [Callosobruchus maculatus]|uniref:Uncharacterized protein n=1 Tax=Callosobruchus maculatus TaxID=64391 RepID=A0A653CBV5_CALMS|nr:unnamed protein product [Callosobruchus maculatus]
MPRQWSMSTPDGQPKNLQFIYIHLFGLGIILVGNKVICPLLTSVLVLLAYLVWF